MYNKDLSTWPQKNYIRKYLPTYLSTFLSQSAATVNADEIDIFTAQLSHLPTCPLSISAAPWPSSALDPTQKGPLSNIQPVGPKYFHPKIYTWQTLAVLDQRSAP